MPRRTLSRALALALLASAGCATTQATDETPLARLAASQPDDPDSWRELQSPHFVFVTNFSSAHARERLARLEVLRTALLAAAWPRAHFPEKPLRVVCFSSATDLKEQLRPPSTVDYWFDSEGGLPVFGWSYENEDQPWVMHQLFHAMVASAGIHQPTWMEEGLASYFSTTRVPDDGRSAEVGYASFRPGMQAEWVSSRLPIADLLRYTHEDVASYRGDYREFFSASRLLVAFLINEHPAQWVELQKRLAAGEDSAHALWSALPGYDADKLDADLARFHNNGVYHARRLELPAPAEDASFAERPVERAEAVRLKAELMTLEEGVPREERVQGAREVLQAALKQKPDDPVMLEMSAALDAQAGHCPEALSADARASSKGALPDAAAGDHQTVQARCAAK